MTYRDPEQERIRKGIKGFVICKDCRLHVGDPRCYRLNDTVEIWNNLPSGFDDLPFFEIQGEKFAIANPIASPDQVPTDVDYSIDATVGSKGESANHCCLVNQDIQLHVRQGDQGFPFTIHFERRSDRDANLQQYAGHGGDWIAGHTNRFREKSKLTSSGYQQPIHLWI